MGLRTPPSSLRKLPFPESTPNRALLRGFPATYFPTLGLGRRSRFFVMIFGPLSLHQKIPFPAAGLEREIRTQLQPCAGVCTAVIRPEPQLFRIEAKRLKQSAPQSRRIAEPLDINTAGQATRRARRSNCSGRILLRDALCGSRIGGIF